jgi:ribosomal protein S27AE
MGNLLRSNQTCPECGSGRGLAVYDDNENCFSCGYHKNFKRKLKNLPDNKYKAWGGKLPYDCTTIIPDRYRAWLYNYFIETPDCVLYSEGADRLIFPVYYHDELKGYQARAIDREPKWISYFYEQSWGKKFPYIATWQGSEYIVIVEDIISALKISKINSCISLLGCSANVNLINFIAKHGEKFKVWLDGDEAGEKGAEKLIKQLSLISDVGAIKTAKDPKCYSYDKIRKYID